MFYPVFICLCQAEFTHTEKHSIIKLTNTSIQTETESYTPINLSVGTIASSISAYVDVGCEWEGCKIKYPVVCGGSQKYKTKSKFIMDICNDLVHLLNNKHISIKEGYVIQYNNFTRLNKILNGNLICSNEKENISQYIQQDKQREMIQIIGNIILAIDFKTTYYENMQNENKLHVNELTLKIVLAVEILSIYLISLRILEMSTEEQRSIFATEDVNLNCASTLNYKSLAIYIAILHNGNALQHYFELIPSVFYN